MKKTLRNLTIAACLLPLAAAGQQKAQEKSGNSQQQNSSTAQRSADRATNTPQMQRRIEREALRSLLTDVPQYGVFDFITFAVTGSTLTLNGDVTAPVLKSNAEKAVKDIEGVEKVVNNINVLPVYSADNAIRIAAYQTIYGDPALQRYAFQSVPPIHIIVNNGNIRLEGAVANKTDADIALARVKTIPNTFQVTSNLKTDEQLAAIEERR